MIKVKYTLYVVRAVLYNKILTEFEPEFVLPEARKRSTNKYNNIIK